jgi:glycosyltransferase involved in cell wall biosynthesis
MSKQSATLSVIVPVYQEAEIIEDSLVELRSVLSHSEYDFEIIVADDGSSDSTRAIVTRLAAELDRIRLVHHPVNMGRGFILMKAIRHSRGDIVAYIDADLQIDPQVLARLADRIRAGSHMAIGSKYHMDSQLFYSPWRRLQSGIYCSFVRFLLGLETWDCQCGAKAFRREAIAGLLPHATCRGWSWDTEMILKGSLLGFHITEVPVTVRPNPGRKSKVRIGSALSMAVHLIRLWLWSRYSGEGFVKKLSQTENRSSLQRHSSVGLCK